MVVVISEAGRSPGSSCQKDNPTEEGGGDPEGEIYSTLPNVTWYSYTPSPSLSSHPLSCPDMPQWLLNKGRRGGSDGRLKGGGQQEDVVFFAGQAYVKINYSSAKMTWFILMVTNLKIRQNISKQD